jgi:hypothetical protein
MATPTGEITLEFEQLKISPHVLSMIQEFSRVRDEYDRAFFGDWGKSPVERELNPHEGQKRVLQAMRYGTYLVGASGWCMPSRKGLHTGIISREEAEGLWIDNPVPVEEDSVFAPREVEVECEIR